jgi:hypothetical protein
MNESEFPISQQDFQEFQLLVQQIKNADTDDFAQLSQLTRLDLRKDLIGADLNCVDLHEINLSNANLSGANLSGANLSEANLSGANLSGANLSEANLSGAKLNQTNLNGANLSGAVLLEADLRLVDLSDVDLSGAVLNRARFGENLGLTELDEQNMQERGAIFVRGSDLPNSHLQKTLSILEEYHPILVTQLDADVIPARRDVETESQRLSLLREEIETLEEQKAEAEAGIQHLPSDIYIQENEPEVKPYIKPWGHGVLTIGRWYMLLLGLNDITGVQIRSLRPSQYPIAILNLLAASCITLGIKQIMTLLGKQNQKNEPNRNFIDDPTHPNTIAWWLKIAKGDGSLWMGLFFISLETCFAAPGLISLLRPELSEQLVFQLAMVAAASLSAAAYVVLDWSFGFDEARHLYDQKKQEQKFKAKLEELRQSDEEQQIRRQNAQLETQGAIAKARLSQLLQDLEHQEAIVFDRRIRARVENQRWEHEVKRWFQDNPDKVAEYNRNQQSQNQHFDKAPSVHE